MKKISIILVIAMLFSVLANCSFSVSAESEFVISASGDLTDYTGPGGDIVIPKEVTYIWAGFASKPITSVTFEEGSQLVYIGSNAFTFVTSNMTVTLPDKTGITLEEWCFWTASIVTIYIPNASTVINGNKAFNPEQVANIYGKNASAAENYASKGPWWIFHDLEYTVNYGTLENYQGIGGEIVIPKEVKYINGTVFKNKNITKVSFEADSQLTFFGDGYWMPLEGSTNVQIVLPDKEGITVKAWSIWATANQITVPNASTVFENGSVWTSSIFKIIAPNNSFAKTFYETNYASGAIGWTFQVYETADNLYSFTYPIYEQNIITGFGIEKTLDAFMQGVTKGSSVVIKAYNGETELLPNEFIGSGTIIRVDNGINVIDYYAVIMGDVSGDGIIGVLDLVNMKKHLLKLEELSGYKFTAGEFFVKGQISIRNLIFLKKYLLGLVQIAN